MIKKILLIACAAAIMLSTCGCSGGKYDVEEVAGNSVEAEDEGEAIILENNSAEENDDSESAENEETPDKTESAEKTQKNNSSDKKESTSKAVAPVSAKKDSGTIKIAGKSLKIGMKITGSFIKSLGTPKDIQNAPSCHYDGSDTIYCYNGYSLYTYANGADNILYLVQIDGSAVSTELGIKTGASADDVKAKYGSPSSETGTSLVYNLSSCAIRFNMSSAGKVTGIDYEEK